jgi:hypothetical protein
MRYRLVIAKSLTLRADVEVEAPNEAAARRKAVAFAGQLPPEGWEKDESGTAYVEHVMVIDPRGERGGA